MKYYEDRLITIQFDESLGPSVMRLLDLVRESSFALLPIKGSDVTVEAVFSSKGFHLFPTVLKTMLFYDPASSCFFKILQPLKLKDRARNLMRDREQHIFALSEWLIPRGVKVPRVRAFGKIREGRKPFFALDRVEGQSLYDILIREQREIPFELCRKVMDQVAGLHGLGYWFGDAHLSHIFVCDGEVSGFIDIDSLRRNRLFRLRHLAKDIAGLNHPRLPVGIQQKETLLHYYMERMAMGDRSWFQQMVSYYTAKRWKAPA